MTISAGLIVFWLICGVIAATIGSAKNPQCSWMVRAWRSVCAQRPYRRGTTEAAAEAARRDAVGSVPEMQCGAEHSRCATEL